MAKITIVCAYEEEIDAEPVAIPGHPWLKLYLHEMDVGYALTEEISGSRFCICNSVEEGVEKVLSIIEKHGVPAIKDKINRFCEARRTLKL